MKYTTKRQREVLVEDFIKVRDTTTFTKYNKNDHEISLKNSLFVVGIYIDKEIVGIGRLVGDNKTTFFVKDVVVLPEYKNNSVGKLIMNELLNYIKENAVNNAYIGLMASKGSESFYEKFGFIKRPNNNFGSGMIKYYEKK